MPEVRTRLRVFVASPGDTEEERERLARVVEELNRGIADELGFVLELVRWETHSRPGIGADPQAVINRQLPHPDIVIGAFWRRLGTPTARAASGTAEELERALTEWQERRPIEVLVYFNREPYSWDRDELEQLASLAQFRDYLERSGVFPWEYAGADEFESLVRQHLTGSLRARPSAETPASPPFAAPAPPTPAPDVVDAPSGWHRALIAGSLTMEIDASNRGDVHTLVAVVRSALDERGLSASLDRVSTVLLELLANVARHSPRGNAAVDMQVQTAFLKRVSIAVQDQGTGFDLRRALGRHYEDIAGGGREHGLLQVSRLADNLTNHQTDSLPWTHLVRCDVYERYGTESVFAPYRFVIPVGIDFDPPETYWLGDDPQSGDDFLRAIHFALENAADPVLDLYLGPLRRTQRSHLGIEVTGDTRPSQVMWFDDDTPQRRTRSMPHSTSSKPHLFVQALERYFRDYFAGRRVIVFADPMAQVGFDIFGWVRSWDLPFFSDERECRAYLAEIRGG